MNKFTGKFAYSTDEERYYGSEDSRESALEEAAASEEDCNEFFIGECVEYIPTVNIESILDQLRDDAYEKAGDAAESFLYPLTSAQKQSLEDSLNAALEKWICANKLTPNFYGIRDSKRYVKDESGKFAEIGEG